MRRILSEVGWLSVGIVGAIAIAVTGLVAWLLSDVASSTQLVVVGILTLGMTTAMGVALLLLLLIAGPHHERIRRTVTTNAAAAWTLSGELDGEARPSLGGWAIEPDVAVSLVRIVRETSPSTVLELGPGASTELLVSLLPEDARIISIEHDADHLRLLKSHLARYAGPTPDLRYAPLSSQRLAGWSGSWYSPSAFTDLADIDLLIVDGPPANRAFDARYPAVPLLIDRLAPDAFVLVDDTGRPDERAAVQRWLAAYPLEPVRWGANCTILQHRPS